MAIKQTHTQRILLLIVADRFIKELFRQSKYINKCGKYILWSRSCLLYLSYWHYFRKWSNKFIIENQWL